MLAWAPIGGASWHRDLAAWQVSGLAHSLPRPSLPPSLPPTQVTTFKMARKAPFSELRRLVSERLGVPPEKQRYWKWSARQNETYRPAQPLVLESEDQPISVSACGGSSRSAGLLGRCSVLDARSASWCLDSRRFPPRVRHARSPPASADDPRDAAAAGAPPGARRHGYPEPVPGDAGHARGPAAAAAAQGEALGAGLGWASSPLHSCSF